MEQFITLLGKENPILASIKSRGFHIPTKIQEKSIPEILQGKDVIAGASTGSGKTLAFASGLIKNARNNFGVQGLVLTPTRELAEQVANELADFSQDKNLNVVSVYGGVSMINQVKRLVSAEIVVGTPGRILDHLSRKTIDLSRVNTLVLDEADRMLDMGFQEDVEEIINHCPKNRQTLLFSATISNDIVQLAQDYMKCPIEISTEQYVDPSKLTQIYYDINDNLKYSLLKYLLENESAKLVMIFCNTRKNVDFVANNLKCMGIETLPLHGGYTQDKRNKIMEQFHSKDVHVLVATDVAARGLDIEGVSHVYNYDIPASEKDYTHRIGRTARAGNEGKVLNLVSSRDYENFSNILNAGEFKITPEKTPYIERARMRWMPKRRESFRNERNSRGFGDRSRSQFREKSGPRRSSSHRRYNSRDSRSSFGTHSRRNSSRRMRHERNFSRRY